LVVLAVFTRSIARLAAIGLVVLGAVLTVAALGLLDFDLIAKLVSFQDASAYGHVDALSRSLDIIRHRPLGQGLGTAGTIGQRFVTSESITNENWYLQIATEMGVISGILFLVIVVVLCLRSLGEYNRVRDVWLRIIMLSVAGGALGFLIVGNFLHAWENTVLSMLFWLFAGIAMRASALDASPSYHATR
jgi:O-antigen ligase